MKKINVYYDDGFGYITEDFQFCIGVLDLATHLMTEKEWKSFNKIGYNYLQIWFDKKINTIKISEEKFKELLEYV